VFLPQALFDAIANEDMDKLQGCLAAGLNVNIVDADGMTPLHYAVDRGVNCMVAALLDSGAALNAQDSDGQVRIRTMHHAPWLPLESN
jgi:ankyrin repeat protein